MREHVAFGRLPEQRIDVDIDGAGDRGHRIGAGGQRRANRMFAGHAVREQLGNARLTSGHGRAMAGKKGDRPQRLQPAQAGHEISQITIRRRHKAGCPAHDVITGKQRIAPQKAHVIAEMSGRMERAQRPVGDRHRRAVVELPIGREGRVDPLVATESHPGQGRHPRRPPGAGIAEGEHRRPRRLGQKPGGGRMVAVRMRHQDLRNPLVASQRGQHRGDMFAIGRPRVDHRYLARPQKPGVRPPMRHRRAVGGKDKPQVGAKGHRLAGRRRGAEQAVGGNRHRGLVKVAGYA